MAEVLNSLTGKLELLPRTISWYSCGPTVYADAHLGHARAYTTLDVLRRILTDYFGHRIQYVMNITDVDDKIIKAANAKTTDECRQFAAKYETLFFKDMADLNVLLPDAITRVSDYIPEIITFIERILENGYGYCDKEEGSVYFDVAQYEKTYKYGVFARSKGGDGKEKRDFVLWKKREKTDGPTWNSPWGTGRPGWHIECSAMSHAIFGDKLDLHSGGCDLAFPHHENEIAQSLAASKQMHWASHFLHVGHLNIRGHKMGKSLRNFITIRDFLASSRNCTANQLRYLFLSHEWHKNMNYSGDESIKVAQVTEKLFADFLAFSPTTNSFNAKITEDDLRLHSKLLEVQKEVDACLRLNLNYVGAMECLKDLVVACNKLPHVHATIRGSCQRFVHRMLTIFGMQFRGTNETAEKVAAALITFREEVRQVAVRNRVPALFRLTDDLRTRVLPSLGVSAGIDTKTT